VLSGPIGTGPLFLAPEAGEPTGSGTVLASGGAHTIANPLQYPSGSNNLTLIVGGTNNLTFTAPFALSGLDGVTSNAYPSRLFQIANTGATTLSGAISDASGFNYAVTKTGSGALYLNAANTYPGVTTNSAGLLAGSGSVSGSVFVTTNASIGGCAAAGIGTFTISGNLTLTNGNGFFRLKKLQAQSNDLVSVSGALADSGAGTITVTNLGAALLPGDTFFLFNKALSGGAVLAVTGGGNVGWSNNLAVNGSIVVVPTTIIPTVQPHIGSFGMGSGKVTINATNGVNGATYYLLESTNLAKPVSQWTSVATNVINTNGASGAFTFTGTNAVTAGDAQQFYILSNTNN
jgi:autotransporter-associated beta strand protein